jgi:glutathione peroxidase
MRATTLSPFFLGAVLLGATACTSSGETLAPSPAPGTDQTPPPSATGKPKGPATPDEPAPAPASCSGAPGELYELSVTKLAETDALKLCTLKGSVVLIVNGASHCGQTYQYGPLQALYAKYKDQKFEVLAFPSKSFNQEKDTDKDVSTFCTDEYKITFPLFTIAPVVDDAAKGETAQPVYQWLKKQPGMEAPVPWNFEKFLVSRDGKAVKRFAYTMNPDPATDPTIENAIKAELAKP